tara:strand:+ start:99490 stop:99627 length:138 start_codon:yes stop_codon:yes gene_type:complete
MCYGCLHKDLMKRGIVPEGTPYEEFYEVMFGGKGKDNEAKTIEDE